MPLTQSAPARLGNVLIERGYVTARTAGSRLEAQRAGGGKLLGEILVERGFCTEDQIVECLAERLWRALRQARARLPTRKSSIAAAGIHRENLVFPLFCIRDMLTVAVTEPTNLFLIDELDALTHMRDADRRRHAATDIRRMITTLPDCKTFVIDDIIEDTRRPKSR